MRQMKMLNKTGAEVMKKHGIIGATDITGFGLAGHALKMAKAGNVSIKLNMDNVPLIGKTFNMVDDACIPGASFRNLEYAENDTSFAPGLDYNLKMIAFDAQTSGGLLMSVPANKAEAVLFQLHSAGLNSSAIIGEVSEKTDKYIYL